MKFTAACIQMNSGDDIDKNIAKAAKFITQAGKKGADFITLPENCALMIESVEKYGGREKIIASGKKFFTAMQKLASTKKCWILVGAVKVSASKSKFYNRSYLIDNKGKLVSSYDKIHLFDVSLPNGESHRESARCEHGDKAVIAKTPWGKLGFTICYDLRFPYLFRQLAEKGADFITVPAAFTYYTGQAHWHTLLRARAIENGCYIIAPGQVGSHPGKRRTYGHSLIIDPWGKILVDGGSKEGIFLAEIDTGLVKKSRTTIPSLSHTRKIKP